MLIQLQEKCGIHYTIEVESSEELANSTCIIHHGTHYYYNQRDSRPGAHRFMEGPAPYEVTEVKEG